MGSGWHHPAAWPSGLISGAFYWAFWWRCSQRSGKHPTKPKEADAEFSAQAPREHFLERGRSVPLKKAVPGITGRMLLSGERPKSSHDNFQVLPEGSRLRKIEHQFRARSAALK